VKYYHGFSIQNSSGDYIQNIQSTKLSFNCRDCKDTGYMQDAWQKTEDCRDCTEIIIGELAYEIQGVEAPYHSMVIRSCFDTVVSMFYCDMCFGCRECFGCFGLRNKEYCILNKQYNKEEYNKLKEKIIEYMRKTKEWGEYFPTKLSPFSYNESMAQDYFPLIREEAIKKGYSWYDHPLRNYKITIPNDNLPDNLDDNILNETIGCSSDVKEYPLCTTAFKITSLELALYKILKLPIPDKCFPCRRQDRFKLRNPRKLWHRKCMKEGCINEFETSYSPDRPEIVYCEKCYQQEVY
jgi:hypothetical protein